MAVAELRAELGVGERRVPRRRPHRRGGLRGARRRRLLDPRRPRRDRRPPPPRRPPRGAGVPDRPHRTSLTIRVFLPSECVLREGPAAHTPMTAARSDRSGGRCLRSGDGDGAHVLSDLRAACGLVAHVDGGDARQADARPRAPGDQGLRLPQGPRRASTSTTTPTASTTRCCAPPTASWTTRRLGRRRWPTPPRGCGRSPPSTARARSAPTSATRRRSTRSAALHVGAAAAGARRAPDVLVGHPGLRQQVRRQRGRVRHVDRAPDPRPRAHRPVPRSSARTRGPRRRASTRSPTCSGSCAGRPAAGARIVFVNPRRIETPDRGVGDTVLDPARHRRLVPRRPAPRDRPPRRVRRRRDRPPRHATSTSCGRSSPRTPPTGSPPSPASTPTSIRELAAAWVATPRASVHASTGHQHGPPGHARLLARAHAVVRHRAPRRRGRQPQERRLLRQRPVRRRRRPSRATSTPSSAGCGAARCPGTLMADAILDSAEPVRAMIVVAGNPLLSIAGQERLRKAFEQLELLVVHRHLPERHRPSSPTSCCRAPTCTSATTSTSSTSARAPGRSRSTRRPSSSRRGERRPEWWIAHRLLQELGEPSLLDDDDAGPVVEVAAHAARGAAASSWPSCRRPATPVVLPAPAPGEFFDQPGADRRRPRRLLPAVVRRRPSSAATDLFAEAERRGADGGCG